MQQYQKNIRLPVSDIILSIKHQHEFFLSQDRDTPDTTIGLSKLFPYTGTTLEIAYKSGASISSATPASSLGFTFAQPIAENAFGRSTRLLDKIVGLEVDVARHQIIEAYEDYLATVITAYYTWYEDYENLMIGQAAYNENLKLLDSMQERQKQKIARSIDVNKVTLQVMSKKERVASLEEKYKNSLNVIQRIMRTTDDFSWIPVGSEPMDHVDAPFKEIFEQFKSQSRTFAILKKLEDKSTLEVSKDADQLLPSIDIIAGYEASGEEYSVKKEDNLFFAGVSMEWPFGNQVAKANHEVSKILNQQQKLSSQNTYYRLYAQLMNLYLQIEREKALMVIAEERIQLAQAILTDERENYSYGKVTLNDYIQAFNDLDNNRFNKITHDALYKKLIVEWLRLRDVLVSRKIVDQRVQELVK